MPIEGLLVDLDGTVYQGAEAIPGAARALDALRADDVPILFTTNTSRMSRADVVSRLAEMGLPIDRDEVLTAPAAAARWLDAEGIRRAMILLPDATLADFAGVELVGSPEAEAVVVGDLGPGFTFERLNAAFRALRAGARLVAVHKNRYWLPVEGPTIDAGPFVVALEYAARVEATLVGKPAPEFFRLAAGILGLPISRLAVVGDDPESDVRGARAARITAIQVETGKFDPGVAAASAPEEPHHRIPSIADLPALLADLR